MRLSPPAMPSRQIACVPHAHHAALHAKPQPFRSKNLGRCFIGPSTRDCCARAIDSESFETSPWDPDIGQHAAF